MSEISELSARMEEAGARARDWLAAARNQAGWWEGRLSSSALSTAVALLALGTLRAEEAGDPAGEGEDRPVAGLIEGGLSWLVRWQNEDGGWGDTRSSRSNIATTLLVWSALGQALSQGREAEELRRAEARAGHWIGQQAGGLETGRLVAALERRYGKDKTFAVPILMACAVGGRLGPEPECWTRVPALPFELAALPREWFAALRLPVVSYALPALIAIGQVRQVRAPGRSPWSWVRKAVIRRTRRLLREIQPDGGGFLEATPLTGFVTMALCSAGAQDDPVVTEAAAFLKRSARPDGSWPIDTNLATWGTSLSVKALGREGLPAGSRSVILEWLLGQQYQEKHPYCLSAPGGWAWTDLPGGVPDADDTAGALLALRELADGDGETERIARAAGAGARWLAGLQNRDGGMPTFCRGWGALPFDRSAPDLTAHALGAWQAWREQPGFAFDPGPHMRRAVAWLVKVQRPDGSWLPLWFGNEHQAEEENPVYGTATVLKYLCRLSTREWPELIPVMTAAAAFLVSARSPEDGAWGGGPAAGPGSIEETGAALEALCSLETRHPGQVPRVVLTAGFEALLALTAEGTRFPAAPIGLYFARLWYYEELYPGIAAVAALRAGARWLKHSGETLKTGGTASPAGCS